MQNKSLFVILGNQLFSPEKYLSDYLKTDFYMSEDYGLCTYFKHHKHKILHTLSSMRSFRDELLGLGARVFYSTIDEKEFKEDYISKLSKKKKKNNYNHLIFFEIEDKFFENKINKLKPSFKITYLKSPMFLFSRSVFADFIKDKKPLMGNFYKFSRMKNDLLVDNNKPIGGKWSFDEENRKKIPKQIEIPKNTTAKKTDHTFKLISFINKEFSTHVGNLEYFWLPTTRKECHLFLNNFIRNKFNLFGDYEDAISKKDDFLFHSALSPILNLGLITPQEIIDVIKKYHDNIRINSYEGLIRQIIGWREFIRGIYQKFEETLFQNNYFANKRKMKKCWYEGSTGIPPLDDAIKKAIKLGYNHHIERLMIIANIMNLSRIDPAEVYSWFMQYYVDASDWVMAPNVFGMGLHSDGGIFATKPYICGSSYLLKMSDYTKGNWTDIVDGLYWKFIDDERDKLKKNPRLGIMIKVLDNMKSDRKNKIYSEAESFLAKTTS